MGRGDDAGAGGGRAGPAAQSHPAPPGPAALLRALPRSRPSPARPGRGGAGTLRRGGSQGAASSPPRTRCVTCSSACRPTARPRCGPPRNSRPTRRGRASPRPAPTSTASSRSTSDSEDAASGGWIRQTPAGNRGRPERSLRGRGRQARPGRAFRPDPDRRGYQVILLVSRTPGRTLDFPSCASRSRPASSRRNASNGWPSSGASARPKIRSSSTSRPSGAATRRRSSCAASRRP